ncbi:MAG: tripartite tricarboxylate transporter substrate binding protein [Pigmentiphaga sp.]|uniref:Bug family tripartite tricarboxylate transporter substrate binding protein n=1 Tax=Pigmentiphaga sp. TaxID=1977564 RepID=UPI0029B03FC7|nr:tripartite tricarboxylate transporter substrate binding protein [Pigmentiphaga sp.]MDX3906334.1 tripartite tricarboxylate transporter substrate binding protein [Pigmentiphaga sp.]
MWKRCVVHAACVAASIGAQAAPGRAQADFPAKPISIIVANAPGSQADLLGRILAQGMSRHIGQNIIVENRLGASGFIAARTTAQAAPDGYTVMLGSSGVMAINPHVYASVPYDARKDFVALAEVASSPNVFLVSGSSSARSLREFAAAASRAGRPANFGSLGTGATTNIVSQLFGRAASLQVTEIAYKGEPAIINDLVAGRLDFSVLPIASSITYIRSGKLKALAVAAQKRTELLADLPTTVEAGYPSVQMTQWFGLFAPAATPPAIVPKLAVAAEAALADAETRQRITQLGVEPGRLNRQAFAGFFASQFEEYRAMVKRLGIRVD